MDKIEKKNYNKTHYLKNRDKLLEKAKERSKSKSRVVSNVLPLFEFAKEQIEVKPVKSKILRWFRLDTLFLGVLVGAMSYFLISETASFYFSLDGDKFGAYFKAILLEGAVLTFSVLRARTSFLKAAYKAMIALIYVYSIWAISGGVFRSSQHEEMNLKTNQQVIQELQSDISRKVELRDRLFETGRITLARSYDQTIDMLTVKLEQSRQVVIQSPDLAIIKNTLAILVIFRILVMICNLLCIQELGRRFKFQTRNA